MYNDKIKSSKGITFTFEGDTEVNALSVSKAIEGLVSISTAIAENNYPEVEFRLSIQALSPGSLTFVFSAAAFAAQTLFTQDTIQYVAGLLSIIKTSFEIKGFLKNKPPKSTTTLDDKIEIERSDGTKIYIPKGGSVYFIDQRIDSSLSEIFSNALISPGVSGIKLTEEDGHSFEISSNEFEECSKKIPLSEIATPKTISVDRKNEILYLRTPDLLGSKQWGFKTDKYIKADIEDTRFLSRVQSGKEIIVAKMYIVADVRVDIEIGGDGLPDENKCHYTITKVHKIHRPEDDQIAIQ